MKIKELIDHLSSIKNELKSCNFLIENLSYDVKSKRTIEVFMGNNSYRAKCSSEYMMASLAAQAKELEAQIEPLQKKFDAIELMLEA